MIASDYSAGSPQAARDVLRVISYRRQELREGLGTHEEADLNRTLCRLRELTGDELLDVILRHPLVISRGLTRS